MNQRHNPPELTLVDNRVAARHGSARAQFGLGGGWFHFVRVTDL